MPGQLGMCFQQAAGDLFSAGPDRSPNLPTTTRIPPCHRHYWHPISTLEEIMSRAKILSDTQIDLIKRLIEFAEENDFFESKLDDEGEREIYQELRATAEELYEEVSSTASADEGPIEPDAEGALEQSIAAENGMPWWDISEVRLGVSPDQLRAQLKEMGRRLKTLVLHSDNLDVRQSILEAVGLLETVEEFFEN
jgi:hypothetical protein